MYIYDIGCNSYEDSFSTQYSHSELYTEEELHAIVKDCVIEALHYKTPNLNGDGWWFWPPSFESIFRSEVFQHALTKRGFKLFEYQAGCYYTGHDNISDRDDFSHLITLHPRANVIPMPANIGFGFTSRNPIPDDILQLGYKYRLDGIYHNYFYTPKAYEWPVAYHKKHERGLVLDGFSPNLNKDLHAGHLKGLAIATSISYLTRMHPVAMLGASLGVKDGALEAYKWWCSLARYSPTTITDTELPPPNVPLVDGEGEYAGCKMWIGPNGPVVVYKSDGKPTYAAHDLALSQHQRYSPDFYMTGNEQKSHFQSLGLGDKHHGIGLLLGKDGRKMRSRSGDAITAKEFFSLVLSKLKPVDETKRDQSFSNAEKLAWNIIVWQFCSADKGHDTKFDEDKWSNPNSPGMMITYTYARFHNALGYDCIKPEGDMPEELISLYGITTYYEYWRYKTIETLEPCYIARYAAELASTMNVVYSKIRLSTAEGWQAYILQHMLSTLRCCMSDLGMYILDRI